VSWSYQLQLSLTGLDMAVAPPPLAATPVSDGIEKYVFSQAAGADDDIRASSVSVTVSVPSPLLLAAATVSGVRRVTAVPLVDVDPFQKTSDSEESQPDCAVVRVLFE